MEKEASGIWKFLNKQKKPCRKKILRRILTPWEKDYENFAFNDPSSFSTTGNPPIDVFETILDTLKSGGDTDVLLRLIDAYGRACTEDEWVCLYAPILRRTRPPEACIGDYNDTYNDIIVPPETILEETIQYAMAIPDADLVNVVLWEDTVEYLDTDFKISKHKNLIFNTVNATGRVPMVLRFYVGDVWYFHDLYIPSVTIPIMKKLDMMMSLWMEYLSDTVLSEYSFVDWTDESLEQHLMGTTGMKIKNIYRSNNLDK